jgi:multiple sugar transport system substrate-binding protein
MPEIVLTVNTTTSEPLAEMKPLLDEFEQQYNVHVGVRLLTWAESWGELVKVALYRRGADISQVGSTWMGGLASMNVLRPFAPSEIAVIGSPEDFIPAMWQSGVTTDGSQVLSLPWITDNFYILYWRDMLEEAGVDETTAFATPEHFEQTLAKLQAKGIPPWACSPSDGLDGLHDMISFVWAQGGDFATPDGRQVLFNEPAARAGMKQYYRLYRYVPPAFHTMRVGDEVPTFFQRQAAITYASVPALTSARQRPDLERIGAAPSPGVSFVGGSSLTIWKDAPYPNQQASVLLAQFLCSYHAQTAYYQRSGLMPTRLDSLAEVAHDRLTASIVNSIRTGRGFYQIPMWGLVEDRLAGALSMIGPEVAANPDADLDVILDRHLLPLARRLSISLSH